VDILRQHGGGNTRLAVDHLDWRAADSLLSHGISVVAGQPVIESARSVKTPVELLLMRAAVANCEDAVRQLIGECRPGITEHELWSILHRENIASGGEWIETRLLASGPRTNPWYQECSDREVKAGDLVALDTDLIGTMGYCCDISRTWRVGGGPPSDRQQRTYADAYSHLMRLLESVGPGVTLTELAEAIGPKPSGYGSYGCLIHGVGMCDEYPVAYWQGQNQAYDDVLQPGMTVCVESYLGPEDGGEGVKLEEQVLVTETGIEVLSTLPFQEDWL
jgi:Xaa-Pro aminopeptidase